jgi:hypothetical protein
MFVSQALQILLVSLAVAAFFVVLGALAVGPEVRDAWGVARDRRLSCAVAYATSARRVERLRRSSAALNTASRGARPSITSART